MMRNPDRSDRPPPSPGEAERSLDRKVRLSAAVLLFERVWRALLWPFLVVGAFLLVSLGGLWSHLAGWPHKVLLAAFAVAALASLAPLFRIALPTRADALRRLERDSGLRHRPATSFEDELAPDATAREKALWAAHRTRLSRLIDRLRVSAPRPRLAEADPYALRALLLLLLAVAFLASARTGLDRVGDSLTLAPAGPQAQFRLDAWVTPPVYTGQPPLVLVDGAHYSATSAEASMRQLTVPERSMLLVRINAEQGARPTVAMVQGDEAEAPPLAPSSEVRGVTDYRIPLLEAGSVVVRLGEQALATWQFDVVKDQPPVVALVGEPRQTPRGALRLNFKVEDDYGVAGAEARFALVEDVPGATAAADDKPLYEAPVVPLTLPRANPKLAEGRTYKDLTAHPWAGLKVQMTLIARDQASQEGRSEPFEMILPARKFSDPLARAIVEQRRHLVRRPAAARLTVADALDALTIAPERFMPDKTVYLGLRAAHWRLRNSAERERIASVADLLWDIALRIEDGDLPDAERALRAAQERLSQAIEEGAPPEEIRRLMDELRQALNQFLQALAERARQQGLMADPQTFGDQRMMTSQDLDQLLRKIEELAKSGSRDLAQRLMNELRDMLERLQMGAFARNPQADQMMNSLDQLGEIIQNQQRLLDETFQALRRRNEAGEGMEGEQGRQGQGQQGQQNGQGQQGQGQLGRRQGDLRGQLEALLEQLRSFGARPPEQLEGAGEAMGEAEGALDDDNLDRATQQQTLALDRLRQGTQQMAEQMMQMMLGQMGPGQSGNAPLDPLGRPERTQGPDLGLSVKVPDEIDIQRAREILEELRRRLGDPSRPLIELDYLERLLRQY